MKTPDFALRMILFAMVVLLLGTSCSRQKKTNSVRPAPKAQVPHPVLIVPNVEVAMVRKGMSRKEVESVIGEPKKKTDGTSFYKGMWVQFDTNGVVFNVKCINGFGGITKEGIGIGSTREEVIAAYGVPDEDKSFKDGEDIWFAPISINFWVQRGKVTSFIVHF